MELYNSKFVYFEWDKKLEGMMGFVAQNIVSLKSQVNDNPKTMVTLSGSDDVCPFTYYVDEEITCDYQFAYYDPDYEVKKAFMEGKTIQARYSPEKCDADVKHEWFDIDLDRAAGGFNFDDFELRLKPELKWHVVLSDEGTLGIAKSTNKHIYFTGNEEECNKWIDEHKDLTDSMKAWEEGKTIQYFYRDDWRDVANNIPLWGLNDTYRVKPDEHKYEPFGTVQELIDAWDKKYPSNMNRPGDTMPLIWIKNKEKNRVYLITDFLFEKCYGCDVGTEEENLELTELFDNFTFLDNSIIGKVKV